jgi:hypothetical protein
VAPVSNNPGKSDGVKPKAGRDSNTDDQTIGLDPFARRRALERRLEDGYHRIEEARLSQLDVRAWEDFWIQILREYERVCDDLGSVAA